MLKALSAGLLAWLIAFCLPLAVLRTDAAPAILPSSAAAATAAPVPETSSAVPAAPAADLPVPADDSLELQVEQDGVSVTMPLSVYLAGVLGGEMPASSPAAALEAQAIAARTFVYRRLYDGSRHASGAAVCTDPGHCMAYAELSEFSPANAERLRGAVEATAGVIAVYGDEPILAVFHAVSGGMTENASDVWGGSVPYLVSVPSPGEESDAMYRSEHTFTAAEFAGRIREAHPEADLSGDPGSWFKDFDRSEAGGIRSVLVGGVRMAGTELRRLFSLPSTDFTVRAEGDSLTLTCTGWGHGVGMSQAGACAMAQAGSTAEEIIGHYYPGAVCVKAEKELTSPADSVIIETRKNPAGEGKEARENGQNQGPSADTAADPPLLKTGGGAAVAGYHPCILRGAGGTAGLHPLPGAAGFFRA